MTAEKPKAIDKFELACPKCDNDITFLTAKYYPAAQMDAFLEEQARKLDGVVSEIVGLNQKAVCAREWTRAVAASLRGRMALKTEKVKKV